MMKYSTSPLTHQMSDQPSNQQPAPDAHAFVLRIWRAGAGTPWHASLRPVDGDTRIGFADAERLIAYLRLLMDDAVANGGDCTAAEQP